MIKKLKVLHIVDLLGFGGAQTIVKGIFESQKDNKNIFLYALRKRKINIEIKHKNIRIFNSNKKYSFKSLFELKDLIKKEKIDILHCHLFKSQFFGWLLKKIYFPNIKLIQHEHGRIFRKQFFYNWFIDFSQKETNLFIAVSKAIRNKLIDYGKVKDNKIKVLYNFVDLDKFSNNLTKEQIFEERKKIGIKKDEFAVGFVGRLAKIKGCEYLIKALPYLNFSYKVLIVGDGVERKSLEDLAKKLKVNGNIRFIGYREDVVYIYSLLDLLIVPSVSESFGLSVIEAQSMEVPVIVSNVPALKEIISDKSGLLFETKNSIDLAKKIKMLHLNNDFKKQLIGNGLENIKKYSYEEFLERLNYLY